MWVYSAHDCMLSLYPVSDGSFIGYLSMLLVLGCIVNKLFALWVPVEGSCTNTDYGAMLIPEYAKTWDGRYSLFTDEVLLIERYFPWSFYGH